MASVKKGKPELRKKVNCRKNEKSVTKFLLGVKDIFFIIVFANSGQMLDSISKGVQELGSRWKVFVADSDNPVFQPAIVWAYWVEIFNRSRIAKSKNQISIPSHKIL